MITTKHISERDITAEEAIACLGRMLERSPEALDVLLGVALSSSDAGQMVGVSDRTIRRSMGRHIEDDRRLFNCGKSGAIRVSMRSLIQRERRLAASKKQH